nr:hypothetical protein [Candidatus Sigynarchaeota archaeon]
MQSREPGRLEPAVEHLEYFSVVFDSRVARDLRIIRCIALAVQNRCRSPRMHFDRRDLWWLLRGIPI